MPRIHFLTEGFVSPNTRAMLFPLIVRRRALKEHGISWRAFTTPHETMFDCDVLVVESNIHGKRWNHDALGILAELKQYKGKVARLFYLDTSDSTALLHPEVLPLVDRYYKGQLLVDQSLYKNAHYGRRLFTNFAHEQFGITDSAPENSVPVSSDADLAKLGVWWNSSLANWSPAGRYRMELYARIAFSPLLTYPRSYAPAGQDRPHDVSCRMGTNYARKTVSWQRVKAQEHLAKRISSNRVSYANYVRELRSSKIVVSPFGWGEINYKDYETFLGGAALVKPDMSHLDTWPNLYQANETYIPYQWDSENLTDVIQSALSDTKATRAVAEHGQEFYRNHLASSTADPVFLKRVSALVNG